MSDFKTVDEILKEIKSNDQDDIAWLTLLSMKLELEELKDRILILETRCKS